MIKSIIIAISPLLLIVFLVFILKKKLMYSSIITLLYSLIIAKFYWQVYYSALGASVLKGILIAIDISIIVFGAVFFLSFLKETKLINSVTNFLTRLSPDRRIQAIILVWFLGSFIEGIAGFGTPAAVVAPLLVGIGFPNIVAVIISLIGNSTAVAFGAVGTPIRIGFYGLDVSNVAFYASFINMFVGVLVPVMILAFVVISKKNKKTREFIEALPFAILAGFCLTLPYFISNFIGQEFPSIIGPIVGLFFISIILKFKIFVPKNIMRFDNEKNISENNIKLKYNLRSFVPYVIFILLLFFGKMFLPKYPITIWRDITHNINLFNPGFLFVLSVIIYSLIFSIKKEKIMKSIKSSFVILFVPFLTIGAVAAFVQIMINSEYNILELPSMMKIFTSSFKTEYLIFLSPFIGAFGAFIAGSATVSNLFFGNFQAEAASSLGYPVAIILALQLIGAGAGNMIALTNVIAAQATVGLSNKEDSIIKRTIIPCLIYLTLTSIIGYIILLLL